MSRELSAPLSPDLAEAFPVCPQTVSRDCFLATTLQICTFIFNNFQDAPPATLFFSNFCIVTRG